MLNGRESAVRIGRRLLLVDGRDYVRFLQFMRNRGCSKRAAGSRKTSTG